MTLTGFEPSTQTVDSNNWQSKDSMAHYPEYNPAPTRLYHAQAQAHEPSFPPSQQYYPDAHLLQGGGNGNQFQQSHAAVNHALPPRQQLYGGEAGAMLPPANVGPAMSSGTPGAGGTIMSPGMLQQHQQHQQQQQQQQQQQYRQPYQTQMRSSEFDTTLIF